MVWCWRLENLNRHWICDGYVYSSSHGDKFSPLPTITISSRTKRFRSVELDTTYVDVSHLHVSSTKVVFFGIKIPVPNQCSWLRPNFYRKDSTNKNYGFLVRSVASRSIGQWGVMHTLGLYFGPDWTIWIGWRHSKRFSPFSCCVFSHLYAPPHPKKEIILT